MGHHIVEKTDLPDELIKDVSGTLGFQDTQPRVSFRELLDKMVIVILSKSSQIAF